jgi:hypothetical protein
MTLSRIQVEKVIDIEDKHGVDILCSTFLELDELKERMNLKVIGEIVAKKLDNDIAVIITVYNRYGEIIGESAVHIEADKFEGIEPFSVLVSIPEGEQVGKVRAFPRRK